MVIEFWRVFSVSTRTTVRQTTLQWGHAEEAWQRWTTRQSFGMGHRMTCFRLKGVTSEWGVGDSVVHLMALTRIVGSLGWGMAASLPLALREADIGSTTRDVRLQQLND